MNDYEWRIRDLNWKLDLATQALKWYASHLHAMERVEDDGRLAAETLEDITDNKN